jgi:hypothetical protein
MKNENIFKHKINKVMEELQSWFHSNVHMIKIGGITSMSHHTKHNRNSLKPQFSGIFIAENTK